MDVITPTSGETQASEKTKNGSVGAIVGVAIVILLVMIGVILIIVYASGPQKSSESSGSAIFSLLGGDSRHQCRVPNNASDDGDGFVQLTNETFPEGNPPSTHDITFSRQQKICFRCSAPSGLPGIQTNPQDQPIYYQRLTTNFPGQEIIIIRDDLLCGGAKTRVLETSLRQDYPANTEEYVYVSRPFGYEQVTLAYSVLRLNMTNKKTGGKMKRAVIFLNPSSQEEGNLDSRLAKELGAEVVFVPTSKNVQEEAQKYVSEKPNRVLLPQGFKSENLIKNIGKIAEKIRNKFGVFDEAFSSIGSGTLQLGLQQGGLAKSYYGVCVYGDGNCPAELGSATPIPPTVPFDAPVPVEQAPPFSSSLHYDAKVWTFIQNRPGKILFYNVLG